MQKFIENRKLTAGLMIVFAFSIVWMVSAGNLYPPAPPSSTMKTLEEVHTAVQALRGTAPKVAFPPNNSALYLQADGIPGDSTEAQHLNWIYAQGYMMNVANGAGPEERPSPLFSGVYISKFTDSASVPLKLRCCNNERIETITLEMVKPGTMIPFVYYRLRLWNARVAFVEPFSTNNGGLEVIAFTDFTRIEWGYRNSSTAEWQFEGWDIPKQGGES
ncbi:MAG: type VI secretion system tube protein Hcp [Sedimentisphaerales bacterium]|nr:type VI secretion system tube protein Hcp [Sedimentisphaerales bacterium]